MAAYIATVDGQALPRTRVAVPTDYDTHEAFLEEMRERYDSGVGFDDHNVKAARDDAKFVVGEQWDDTVKEKRQRAKKPILTVNRLVAFVAQIVGNRLMNETEIRVHPEKAGTKEVAKIREGLIRSIYKNSQADFARDNAMLYQVIGGQGVFCLSIDYASNDVFEQKIALKAVADPYSAVFDPLGIDPSGGDCEWTFVGDDIPAKDFRKRWPWAAEVAFDGESTWNGSGLWKDGEYIRVVAYWRMVTEGTKTLALYQDGTVHDVTEKEEFEYLHLVETRSDGTPYTRDVPNRFARLYICSGNAILEGPHDYPISSIPVYRVPGWEVNDGERIHRWGLIRFLKDPQRLHNYWRSVLAEQLVAAPRNKWLATPDAVRGHENRWRNAPGSDDPFLFYNDGETTPIHVPPPGIDAALVNEAGMATQDIRDVSNIHEAALGMQSNEVSGKAIQARQTVSDVGTFIYHDRLRLADERCAININELVPHIYDTKRMEVIIGDDDKPLLMTLNDPADPNSDMTMGQYGVRVAIGPATATKRALAAEQMMAFVNAIPQSAEKVMDLVADAQDWPKAQEFARRFRMTMPNGMIAPEDMTPEQQQVMAAQQESAKLREELELANAKAEIAGKEAKAANDSARAELAKAQAFKAISDAKARIMDVRGGLDDDEFQRMMSVLDQHNSLAGEDRDFDANEDERKSRKTENTNAQ